MSDIEETGAIDWLLIEAQGKEITGELVPPLLDLVDRRLIRILDVLVLVKRDEGDFDALTTAELDPIRWATSVSWRAHRQGVVQRGCGGSGRADARQPRPPDRL